LRSVRVLNHSSSEKADDAPVLFRLIDDELKARDRGCETREYDSSLRRAEDRFEAIVHGSLRSGIPGVFGIRAVGEECQHSLIAICGERVKIEKLSVHRRRVDFEIARMDHRSRRSSDRKSEGIDDRMRDVKELHAEAVDGNLVF